MIALLAMRRQSSAMPSGSGNLAATRTYWGGGLSLNGYPISVIGVTPPSFFGVEVGHRYDVAIPLCADRLMSEDIKGAYQAAAAWWLSMMGRLKPGWTVTRASAYLTATSPAFKMKEDNFPEDYKPDLAKRYLANKLNAKEANNGVSDIREARRYR